MGSAFHQLCPRYSGTLTLTAPTAIRLWDTFTFLPLPFKVKIRGGIEDTVIQRYFFLFLNENIYCDPSLGRSRRDGSNDGSQNMYFWKNMDNYPKIISVTPSYLEH